MTEQEREMLDSEMDKYFEEMELTEMEMIFEDTFHKICEHFYQLGKSQSKHF